MELKEITNKADWEAFLATQGRKTFLHSFAWGEFHNSLGNKAWRFGIFEGNQQIAAALVIKIRSRRGDFLLVPHGPVGDLKVLPLLLEKLKDLAKREKADFIRISPIAPRTPENVAAFKKLGFRQGPLHYHPESSWKLDITKSEDEILAGMRKTTRYEIRQAQKNPDIEFIKSTNLDDLDIFYNIHNEVVKVQKFVPFSLEYLKKEFSAFLQDNQIVLYFAKYKGQYIAGSFEIFTSGAGFYHHAGLLPEFRKLPVSALLQWEAIQEAKSRGCTTYDFWGYANPATQPNHPYAGPTLFKQGFGGYLDEYVKTQDYIISPKYWLHYIIELTRKLRRGL